MTDHGRDAAEELVAVFPCASGGDGFFGHLVEPADDFLGVGEDVLRFVRHVFGAEEKLHDEHRGGLGEVMGEAPPRRDFVQANRIGVGRDKFQHAAGGLDAGGGGGAAEFFGFLGLVGDAVFHAAQTGPVHDDFHRVVEEPKTHALAVELLITLSLSEVEERGQTGAPAFEFLVKVRDGGLDLGPGFQCSGRAVKIPHDVVCYGAEESEFGEVEGDVWWDVLEDIE